MRIPSRVLLLLFPILVPVPAHAALDVVPYVAASVAHDSNVLRLHDDAAALEQRGDPEREDTLKVYSVGVEAKYQLGRQKLSFDAAASKSEYNRFTQLDYEAHGVSGALDWAVGRALEGTIRASESRALENFANRVEERTDRGFRDETNMNSDLRLRIGNRYQLKPGVEIKRYRYSLLTSRFQDLDEDTLRLAFSALGLAGVDVGLEGIFSDGDFIRREAGEGVIDEYRQTTVQLVANWKPSPITTLDLNLGSSRRDNRGLDVRDTSGFVGSLSLARNLSVKTSLYFGAYRNISSAEVQGQSTVTINGLSAGGNWKPTDRLSMNLGYLFQKEKFAEPLSVGSEPDEAADSSGRKDELESVRISADYRVRRWLVLKPYYRWESRSSKVTSQDYDGFEAGIELRLQYGAS